MPQVTRDNLVTQTREFMDAEGSDRWTDNTILLVLDQVFDNEWSNVLNAAPFYTFAVRTVTVDQAGRIPFSVLNGGSGDNQENFYRLMSLSDGNNLFEEVTFRDVPTALTSGMMPTQPRMFYQAGQSFQVIPPTQALPLYATVNWKPTAIRDLSSGGSFVQFPPRAHLIVVYEAAATLLMKGGTESSQAAELRGLAAQERGAMLDDIRRTTMNPTRMNFPDTKYEWGGF